MFDRVERGPYVSHTKMSSCRVSIETTGNINLTVDFQLSIVEHGS